MRELVLAGRPNSGKSTLFNRMASEQQKVANYAGCTVEKKTALAEIENHTYLISDIPGIYSLKSNTRDEEEAIRHIENVGDNALLLLVVDGNNLKDELILPLILKDRGYEIAIAVNMMDEVRANKKILDIAGMTALAGVPLFPISAKTGEGIESLKKYLARTLLSKCTSNPKKIFGLSNSEIIQAINQAKTQASRIYPQSSDTLDPLTKRNILLDKIFVHPFLGPIIFLLVMFLLFQAVFTWASPVSDLLESGIGWTQEQAHAISDSLWMSLFADGVLGGVGAVVVFVPPIAFLFFFIGVLELSGYLPRAAYMVDRLLKPYGLEGKVFIPLLSSVACAVPGILSTRTIENERTRLLTIMISPLMTCSARLPVYTLLIASFIPEGSIAGLPYRGLAMFVMYVLGILMALIVALLIHRFGFSRKKTSLDFIHLPMYRLPDWKVLLKYIGGRVWAFLRKAGTVIAVMAVMVWMLLSFPRLEKPADWSTEYFASEQLKQSYGGKLGQFLEPVFSPIGFDWKITIGVVASLAAREVFVSTLGTVFALEDPESEAALSDSLQSAVKADGSKAYTVATCFSLLVFFAFSLQCISTIGVAIRETASYKIPLIMFVYMFALAYGAAFLVYRFTLLLM